MLEDVDFNIGDQLGLDSPIAESLMPQDDLMTGSIDYDSNSFLLQSVDQYSGLSQVGGIESFDLCNSIRFDNSLAENLAVTDQYDGMSYGSLDLPSIDHSINVGNHADLIEPSPCFFDANNSGIMEPTADGLMIHHDDDLYPVSEKSIGIGNTAHEAEPSFGGAHYTDAEIDKMKREVSSAENILNNRKSDVSNWEQKVSLNDTKSHKANGDYDHAVDRLNEAKSRYNDALDKLNSAKEKLNNAT